MIRSFGAGNEGGDTSVEMGGAPPENRMQIHNALVANAARIIKNEMQSRPPGLETRFRGRA